MQLNKCQVVALILTILSLIALSVVINLVVIDYKKPDLLPGKYCDTPFYGNITKLFHLLCSIFDLAFEYNVYSDASCTNMVYKKAIYFVSNVNKEHYKVGEKIIVYCNCYSDGDNNYENWYRKPPQMKKRTFFTQYGFILIFGVTVISVLFGVMVCCFNRKCSLELEGERSNLLSFPTVTYCDNDSDSDVDSLSF